MLYHSFMHTIILEAEHEMILQLHYPQPAGFLKACVTLNMTTYPTQKTVP